MSPKNGVRPNVIPPQFCIITVVRAVQDLNALSPIDVTPLGIDTDVRDWHDMNALAPIDVTLLGIVTDARELQ